MSALGEYNGQAYTVMSDKGRFVLPPAFRKAVKASSDGAKTLCLAVHDKYDCLIGFGLSRIPELHAQLEKEEERAVRLSQDDFDADARAGQLFGFEQIPFDDSGRFVMPEHLKELGFVEEGLYFHGAGKFFFVWNPDQLAEMGSAFRGAQASCRAQMAKATKKGAGK
ncbi:MAG: division/cell wall cluster transcriptional repressor MraZ [Pseudomonadota bacterium]